MWAIAIWDDKARTLFLARDRLGIKPLYYFHSPSGLYFASEIKAILPVLPDHPELAEGLIDAYMTFGYVPGEDALLADQAPTAGALSPVARQSDRGASILGLAVWK